MRSHAYSRPRNPHLLLHHRSPNTRALPNLMLPQRHGHRRRHLDHLNKKRHYPTAEFASHCLLEESPAAQCRLQLDPRQDLNPRHNPASRSHNSRPHGPFLLHCRARRRSRYLRGRARSSSSRPNPESLPSWLRLLRNLVRNTTRVRICPLRNRATNIERRTLVVQCRIWRWVLATTELQHNDISPSAWYVVA